jgi:hypothetical protein
VDAREDGFSLPSSRVLRTPQPWPRKRRLDEDSSRGLESCQPRRSVMEVLALTPIETVCSSLDGVWDAGRSRIVLEGKDHRRDGPVTASLFRSFKKRRHTKDARTIKLNRGLSPRGLCFTAGIAATSRREAVGAFGKRLPGDSPAPGGAGRATFRRLRQGHVHPETLGSRREDRAVSPVPALQAFALAGYLTRDFATSFLSSVARSSSTRSASSRLFSASCNSASWRARRSLSLRRRASTSAE